MSTELIINASLPETRIALMEDGEIQDLLIERASGKGIVGNIYKGRVTRVLPGMQAAFVDIGLEKAAFLYVDDVFVHSEIWEAEEGEPEQQAGPEAGSERKHQRGEGEAHVLPTPNDVSRPQIVTASSASAEESPAPAQEAAPSTGGGTVDDAEVAQWESEISGPDGDEDGDEGEGQSEEDDEEEDDDDHGPVGMGPGPDGGDEGGNGGGGDPQGTVRPDKSGSAPASEGGGSGEGQQAQGAGETGGAGTGEAGGEAGAEAGGEAGGEGDPRRRRHRRGRRGGRFRKRTREEGGTDQEGVTAEGGSETGVEGGGEAVVQASPDNGDSFYRDQDSDESKGQSDRSALTEQREARGTIASTEGADGRPEINVGAATGGRQQTGPAGGSGGGGGKRPEFKEPRARDRRIKSKPAGKSVRAQAKIEELLKEGQEVIVQVAKDPIATKGARLTCHISLPGRHLVCMPTIDHVGVSRRIERDDERKKLREYVERYRPKNLGFIVRTASGRQQSEKRIKQDIEYLTRLWGEIREKAAEVSAPALVYEDLNSVLRAIRDWVTEDIDKIVVDSRYHYNDIQRFVSHFMPSLKQKVELYGGDVPIFDAYNISTELARGLERKVWLKSGGYLVVDQAEALVAIDVNTGRFVGKKNLEDTILKTNLEAVQEIAYQLRLRNCGGIIILDLIDMEREENKQRVYRALEEALKKDRARPSILKISELGLVEMTRKRTRDTMVRALCDSCTHCEGKGFVKSKQTVAYEALRELERVGIERDIAKVLVQAHPDVIDIMAIDERDTLDQLERRYRKQIYLQAVADYHMERFEVSGDKHEKGERGLDAAGDNDRNPRESRGGGRDRDRGGSGGSGDRDRGGRNRNRGRDRDRGGSGGKDGERGGRDNERGVSVKSGGGLPTPLSTPIAIVPRSSNSNNNPVGMDSADMSEADLSGATPGMLHSSGQPRAGGDDFYSEEDRLAFLRAQATQDAALARLSGAPAQAGANPRRSPQPEGLGLGRAPGGGTGRAGQGPRQAPSQGAPGEGPASDRDGRRGRRGRRGGRFRRGGKEGDEGRGPVSAGGPVVGGPKVFITPRGSSSNGEGGGGTGTSDGGGSSGGSSGSDSGGGSGGSAPSGGGGGDHTPPTST